MRLAAVAPAPTPVDTDAIAEGAVVALTVEAPGPAKNPNVVFSLAVGTNGCGNISARGTANDVAVLYRVIVCTRDNRCRQCDANY